MDFTAENSTPAIILPSKTKKTALNVATQGTSATATGGASVHVHPMVLLSVLDHHTRRPDVGASQGNNRVIGTLLGNWRVEKNQKIVEITNCFAVPHAERGDEVAIGKDFNRQMLALHMRSNPKEMVVGWYATAMKESSEEDDDEEEEYKCIADTSSLIHEFYSGECEDGDPIHLVIDTSLVTDSIGIKAYKSTPVQLKGEALGNLFNEIKVSIKTTESERITLDHMITSSSKKEEENKSENTTDLEVSMERLLSLLEKASEFVDKVVDDYDSENDAQNEKVGRAIADTLSSVPRIRPEVFDKMFNDSLQDLLMVTYLSNITRTQLSIAEKLNASLTV